MSDSVRPHRRQPTRLPRPWDSPDKNTGVGCHFLLQCMKVKSESEVAQSCPTLSDPMDCSLPGSSAHGIFLDLPPNHLLIPYLWLVRICLGNVILLEYNLANLKTFIGMLLIQTLFEALRTPKEGGIAHPHESPSLVDIPINPNWVEYSKFLKNTLLKKLNVSLNFNI